MTVGLAGLPGLGYPCSGKVAVTGTFTGTGQSPSFTPLAGRGFNASLWGTFSATVQVERSFDNGTTWLILTANGTQLEKFTGSSVISETLQEDEFGVVYPVIYRFNCTAFVSGTVNYRLSQ